VEFALLLVLLVPLVFGILQYGLYLWAANSASSAAREGLRRVVVGECFDNAELTAYIQDQLGGAGDADSLEVTTTPSNLATAEVGSLVHLSVEFQALDLGFWPIPDDGLVSRTYAGRLEDTEAGEACVA
jgi:hypothetical protein